MLPYLITFSLSSMLFAAAEGVQRDEGGKALAALLNGAALFVPCALAGARDMNIGTDTGGYGLWAYGLSQHATSFGQFYQQVTSGNYDIQLLYAIVSFVVVKLTNSTFCYFFVIELLILTPVYFSVKKLSEGRYVWVVMMAYYLIFYIFGLNAMRQSIAMGFVLIGFVYLMRGGKIKSLVLMFAAIMFHLTGVVGIVLYIVWFVVFEVSGMKVNARKYAAPIILFLFVIAVLCFVFFEELMLLVLDIAPSFARYALYATHSGDAFGISSIAVAGTMAIGLIILSRQRQMLGDSLVKMLLGIVAATLFFDLLARIDTTIERMGYFTLLFSTLLLSLCMKTAERPLRIHVGLVIVFTSCMLQFGWGYVVQGFNEAVPYTSTMWGI